MLGAIAPIGNTQRLLAKNNSDPTQALNLLTQAEENIRQAIQLNTAGDYQKNLAYDYTALGLLRAERSHFWPFEGASLPEQIAQFEEYYSIGLGYFAELGRAVERAAEALDIARAYLEVKVLENCDRAEEIARASLQVFREYNRRQLVAAASRLLGEIYLVRASRGESGAAETAAQFLADSLEIYRDLDLEKKAAEVEELIAIGFPLNELKMRGDRPIA